MSWGTTLGESEEFIRRNLKQFGSQMSAVYLAKTRFYENGLYLNK